MPENEPLSAGDDALKRAEILREHTDAVLEVKQRAQRVFGEMILLEMDYLVTCGWDKVNAYLPAVNNLAVRWKELEGELLTELGRLQGVLRRRLQRLAEEQQDSSRES